MKFFNLNLHLLVILCLIFGVTISCSNLQKDSEQDVLSAESIEKNNVKLVLEDLLKQKSKNPADVVKWMEMCSKRCDSPDREIASDLADGYGRLFAVSKINSKLSQLSTDQKKSVAEGQVKIRRAFLRILEVKDGRDILETAYRELANPDSLYYGLDPEVQKTTQNAIERLRKKPDTEATGWYLKALSLPQSSENLIELISSYRSCVLAAKKSHQLDDMICRANYEEFVRFYERPKCQEPYFNSEITFESDEIVLVASDLLESTLENIGPDHWEIWFSLKTFSCKKLEDFTATSSTLKKNLLMKYKGNVLAKAQVNQKITDGSFRMTFENIGLAQEAFDKLCKTPSPEKLPENLRL